MQYFKALGADIAEQERGWDGTRGLMVYNKRDYQKKGAPRQSVDNWIVATVQHKGIISGEDWVEIQKILEENRQTSEQPRRTRNGCTVLSGMIYCNICGQRMFAKHRSGRDGYDYICKSKLQGGVKSCEIPNLHGRETDQAVWNAVLPLLVMDPSCSNELLKLEDKVRTEAVKSDLELVNCKMAEHRRTTAHLVNVLELGEASPTLIAEINRRMALLEDEMIELTQKSAQYRECASNGETISEIVERLSCFYNLCNGATGEIRRETISLLTERIVWDGRELKIMTYPAK